MDHRRFDTALRALDAAVSRRRGLAAALAVFLGARVSVDDEAEAAGRDVRPNGRSPRPVGPCGNGSRPQNICRRDNDCCTGVCDRRPGKRNIDGLGRCRCIRKGRPCSEDRNCCRGLGCFDGTCGPKRPLVATGKPCTAEDQCSNAKATCTSYETNPGGGTFCLLPRYVFCSNANHCAAGACIESACGGPEPTAGSRCSTTDDCPEGMVCSSGLCFNVTPCPVAFCSGMWCTFDRSQDDELSGDGGATGKMHMPNRIVILPDKSAFISVETQMNRIQKFDPYTFDWLGDMSAATTTSHTPPTGSGDGEFNSPQDIVMRPDGTEAYVVDKGNSRITVIDPQAWTVLRQIPVTSDALAPDIDMNACVAAAYDSVGDRLILLMSAYGYPNYNSAFAIVPVDGGTQSNYPLAGVEYVQVEVSADGSRVYLFRKKSAQILDATFNEISGGTYGTDTADCRNGFGNVGFGPGATTIDEEGYLWVGDGSCRRHIQFDVTGDAWSVKTWIGHSDDFVGTSPMMRPDGMLLLFNRDSDTNAMTTRCRNPQMADGTPWRSATVRRNRQRRR